MMSHVKIAAIAAALLVVPQAGAVDPNVNIGSGQFAIGITGFVPVICRASVSATSVAPQAGQVSLGALTEFCNNPNGYEVYADYSPELANAKLIVGGQSVPLSTAGSTRVSKSDRAAIDARDLSLDLPEGTGSAAISFRIVPL